MALSTFQGVVKNGQIRLVDDMTLPEDAEVYLVVPDLASLPRARVQSPRQAQPEQAANFAKQIVQVARDADL